MAHTNSSFATNNFEGCVIWLGKICIFTTSSSLYSDIPVQSLHRFDLFSPSCSCLLCFLFSPRDVCYLMFALAMSRRYCTRCMMTLNAARSKRKLTPPITSPWEPRLDDIFYGHKIHWSDYFRHLHVSLNALLITY